MKETFIIRTEWIEAMHELAPAEQGAIMMNLFYYHNDQKNLINLNNQLVRIVWKLIEPTLQRTITNYDARTDTSRQNGKLGGRPEGSSTVIKDVNGNVVPKHGNGDHFIYLIYDSDLDQYKIGETNNLLNRRLSIKRPTKFLSIVSFEILSAVECQKVEKEIISRFENNRVSGDWFVLNEREVSEILGIIERNKPNKPNGNLTETKKPDNDSVSDCVIDNDCVSEIVEERTSNDGNDNEGFEKEKNLTPVFVAANREILKPFKPPPPPPESWEQCGEILKVNSNMEQLVLEQHKKGRDQFVKLVDMFVQVQKAIKADLTNKTGGDLQRHFLNWLNKQNQNKAHGNLKSTTLISGTDAENPLERRKNGITIADLDGGGVKRRPFGKTPARVSEGVS